MHNDTVLAPATVNPGRRQAGMIRQVLMPLFKNDNTTVVIPSMLLAEFMTLVNSSSWVRNRVRQAEWVFDDSTENLTLSLC